MKSQEKPLHARPARKRDETKRMSGKETKNNMIRYKVRFPFLFRSFLSKQTAPCKMRKPLILNLQNPGKKGQIFIHFFPRFSQQTNNKKAKKKEIQFLNLIYQISRASCSRLVGEKENERNQ